MLRNLPAAFEDLCSLLGCLMATAVCVYPAACVLFSPCPPVLTSMDPSCLPCCLSHTMVWMVLLSFPSPLVCLAPGKACSFPLLTVLHKTQEVCVCQCTNLGMQKKNVA